MPKRCHTPRVDAHELALLYLCRVIPPALRRAIDVLLWRLYLEPAPEPEAAEKANCEHTVMRTLKMGHVGGDVLFGFQSYWQDVMPTDGGQ